MIAGVDIEVTNRCNAKCYFCPRDRTPHQGLMTTETFDQALARAVELDGQLRDRIGVGLPTVNLCGLGEPLLHRETPAFARKVVDAGLACQVVSNAALLDEERGQALLDAGVRSVWLNVGERREDYEEVYKLPWARTRDNVRRFARMARGRCKVHLVLVDHRKDPEHIAELKAFWKPLGVRHFLEFDIMNRGGTLSFEEMQYEHLKEVPPAMELLRSAGGGSLAPCTVPFTYLFVGYDGNHYLCCSDWEKKVPLGSVFDRSFLDVVEAKLAHVREREPICKLCNHDPANQVADALRTSGPAEATTVAADQTAAAQAALATLEQLAPGSTAGSRRARRHIPVTAL